MSKVTGNVIAAREKSGSGEVERTNLGPFVDILFVSFRDTLVLCRRFYLTHLWTVSFVSYVGTFWPFVGICFVSFVDT